jgi:hypothetical protein
VASSDSGGALLTSLPVVYAVAIALHDVGVPASVIAERLGVAEESMPALLKIAQAKLERLRERDERSGRGDDFSGGRDDHSRNT